MKKSPMVENFLDALLAVLAGNAIYFLSMPYLPLVVQHRAPQEDWGLGLDFVICLTIFLCARGKKQT